VLEVFVVTAFLICETVDRNNDWMFLLLNKVVGDDFSSKRPLDFFDDIPECTELSDTPFEHQTYK